jgi:hypothetical protein
MASTNALREGNWREAMENVQKLKMWGLMNNSESVLNMIRDKIKEISLKTYLLTYGSQYSSVSLDTLADMFEMEPNKVYRHVSQMIFNDQLHGSWDGPSKCLIMASKKHTQLQASALAYGEKAALFVEQNERLMEQRYGFYTHKNPNDKFRDGGSYHNHGGGGGGGSFNNFRRGDNRRESKFGEAR